jgi:hypothetical protein
MSDGDYSFLQSVLYKNSAKILDLVEDESTSNILSELFDKLGQFFHMDIFLTNKYSNDQLVTVKIVVETSEQTFEDDMDGNAVVVQNLITQMKVRALKLQK